VQVAGPSAKEQASKTTAAERNRFLIVLFMTLIFGELDFLQTYAHIEHKNQFVEHLQREG
jgi:hypothetical protein